jgi:hypothetical protein
VRYNGGGLPLNEWASEVILDGKPFTFARHEYLEEPYRDDHPYQVEMKAAQLGLTTKALLRSLYLCRYGNFRGVLYLFPSRTDVLDFSKSRVTPLIQENPGAIGEWLRDTDSVFTICFRKPSSGTWLNEVLLTGGSHFSRKRTTSGFVSCLRMRLHAYCKNARSIS